MNIMRYICAGLAAIATCVINGCGNPASDSSAPQWKEFSSQQGRFALLMPGVPSEKKSFLETRLGPIEDHAFLLKTRQSGRKAAYLISYLDYPQGHTQKFNPNDFLEKTWQDAYGDIGGRKLIYKKIITLNGFAGLEFQYQGKGTSTSLTTARDYLVNNRIYQLAAIMSKEQVDEGDAQKYLGSFRLLK